MAKSNKQWLRRHVTDPYVRKAREQGYRSRSAFKLLEIDDKEKLLRPGAIVVDLGAAPGGWSQVAAARVKPGGRVIAIDLLKIAPITGVEMVQEDFRAAKLEGVRADIVLSDLAPNLSGVANVDQARAAGLAFAAIDFCRNTLKNLVIWLVIGLVLMTVFNQFNTRQAAQAPMEYSQFLEEVKAGRIAKVTIEGRQLKAQTTEGKRVTSYSPGDIWLVSDLLKYGVKIEAKPEEEPSLLMNIFVSWFPMLLLIGVWIFFMRQMQVGSPGTGKTLLARAIAGEAKVPFFSISGSDFVEMFVGVGAARVRDMFEQAKKHAPCIVFIDEIDAVGRQRGAGLGGGNDEREQTLNQLLVEMDGFEATMGVIVIAATNRPDVLDPALLRPGRFDRQVVVPLPDIRGREEILKVHMRKVPLAPDVKPDIIARGTPGFSGADLANIVNEAALFAARGNKRLVDMDDFERAKDKIIMGAERRSMVMPEEERRNTAYHESGHAVVAKLLPKTDPVHKVTIIPRGRALGVTMQLPEQDRYSMDRDRLLSTIAVLFGGRIAEELFMGQMTTGASNDFERATALARSMVTQWGMSDEMGPMVYGENEGEVFLGRSITTHKNVSEVTMQKVDAEIRKIIDQQFALAKKLILDNRDKVEAMAKALLELETIDAEQIQDIMDGRPPRPPKPTQAPQQPPQAGAPGAPEPAPVA